MIGYWHVTYSSVDRLALFRGEARRRIAVKTVVRLAGSGLLLFCVVDDHIHVVIECRPDKVRVVAAAIVRGLRAIAAAPMSDAFIRPVERRTHLSHLVKYALDQSDHHGIDAHPALWSGSCFQDLVGARVIGMPTTPLREALPRLSRADLFRSVGLCVVDPATDAELRSAGAPRIVAAASAVLAADPAFRRRTSDVVGARKIAVRVGRIAGVSRADVAWALSITGAGGRKLEGYEVDPRYIEAVRRRIALEDAVASTRRTVPLDRAARVAR